MAHLRAELAGLPTPASLKDLEQLPYLNACILEANRLSFGLTRRVSRTAPSEALQYGDYNIPPNTPFATSTLAIHANEEIFPDPWTFKPERWLYHDENASAGNSEWRFSDEAMKKRKFNMAFGYKGPRMCLGMHLAEAEMRLAIAAVAGLDMELFETDLGDVEYRHDFQVAHGRLGSEGVRAVVKGRMGKEVR